MTPTSGKHWPSTEITPEIQSPDDLKPGERGHCGNRVYERCLNGHVLDLGRLWAVAGVRPGGSFDDMPSVLGKGDGYQWRVCKGCDPEAWECEADERIGQQLK